MTESGVKCFTMSSKISCKKKKEIVGTIVYEKTSLFCNWVKKNPVNFFFSFITSLHTEMGSKINTKCSSGVTEEYLKSLSALYLKGFCKE